MKFLELYIKDTNLLWLINKYLKAGVITEGVYEESAEGSAQGNIISPMPANIYMHNVLTLWYKFVVLNETNGKSFLVVFIMRSRMRESRTYGSVRGLWREPLVYSTAVDL